MLIKLSSEKNTISSSITRAEGLNIPRPYEFIGFKNNELVAIKL